MTLQEILADPKTFTDGMEMTIGDSKVSLGELRNLSNSRQKEISDKIAAADQREAQARDTAIKAANLLSELEKAKETLSAAPKVTTEDDFEKEEFWSPVRKRMSERDKKLDDAIKLIGALENSVKQAASIWAEDRWQGQFEKVAPRLKKVKEYENWDYTKVRDYAAQNKILDAHGMPSVEKAVMELTKANDIETIKREAFEEGQKAARSKARLESMPRPSSASGGKGVPKGKSAVEEIGLEGLGDDVMNDAELMDQLSALQDLNTLQ